MLNLLDDSVAAFLRATVPLGAGDVDISFEAPDRDWGSRITRPTVNLFLRDVRPNLDEREGGMVTRPCDNGRTLRHGPLPRLDCRYLVTAWTTEVADEHALLGRVLTALLLNPVMGAEFCKGPLSTTEPPPRFTLAAAQADNSDFWSALGGQLKPGLDLLVTLTVNAVQLHRAGPPVREVDATAHQGLNPQPRPPAVG